MKQPVIAIDLATDKISAKIYASKTEAYSKSGVHVKTISNSIRAGRCTAAGVLWEAYDPLIHKPDNHNTKDRLWAAKVEFEKRCDEAFYHNKTSNVSLRVAHCKTSSRHRMYRPWYMMMYRCYVDDPIYETHKIKGVEVVPEWHDYDTFVADMDATYFEGAVLDREDNDGPYSKDNCQWLSRGMNAQKDLSNVVYQYDKKGAYIASHVSQQEVNRFLGNDIKNGSLRTAMKRKKPYKGFYWSNTKYDNLPTTEMTTHKQNISSAVLQFNLDGQFIARWDSPKDAVKNTGVNSGGLSQVCNGKMNKTMGCYWRYETDTTGMAATYSKTPEGVPYLDGVSYL